MKRKGFTLIDLLVVICIIGVLISMVAPLLVVFLGGSKPAVDPNNETPVTVPVDTPPSDDQFSYVLPGDLAWAS